MTEAKEFVIKHKHNEEVVFWNEHHQCFVSSAKKATKYESEPEAYMKVLALSRLPNLRYKK